MGKNDGEEDNAEPAVDEGRGAHAEEARGPADKDSGDRAQAQAERGCRVSAGIKGGRDGGRRSREEGSVRGALRIGRRKCDYELRKWWA
jgi:hypothetical protein